MYRNNKGQYISKSKKEYFVLRRFKLFCFGVACSIILGIVAENKTVVYETPEVEASEVVPDWNPCELHSVVCEDEKNYDDKVKEIPHNSPITSDRIRLAYKKADEAGINGDVLLHVAWCESGLLNVQSALHYTFSDASRGIVKGDQERSYGWYMVHTPDHDVTADQALNVEWAIGWAIDQIKDGNYPWYGYSEETDTCASGVDEYWK